MSANRTLNRAGILAMAVAMLLSLSMAALAQDDGESYDHSEIGMLAGPFETAPEVTATCLNCHADTAQEVMATSHWTWDYESPVTGETYGKDNVINNYCVNVRTNYPRCTSCHAGYGWRDDTFDFSAETNVDCLVCHDQSGQYKKFPTGAGHPAYEDTAFSGKDWPAVDLVASAQSVGSPTRANCGSCHFTGGGGDAVKHGDMDTSLKAPEYEVDVHMSPDGANLDCVDCHTTENHDISGSRYVADGRVSCENCHEADPHELDTINEHTATVACQTCHIPEYARAQPTKMTWDWTTAGDKNEDGSIKIVDDEATGKPLYDSRKGDFTWEGNVVPAYRWNNGNFDWTIPGETVDAATGFVINQPMGTNGDGKIYPFKLFAGAQPFDAATGNVAALHLFPSSPDDSTAFWKVWDLNAGIAEAMAAYGMEYSGSYESIDSEMYWPITHMVAPAEQALECEACHSTDGRLDFAALGFADERLAELTVFPPGPPEPTTTTEAPTTTATEAPAPTTTVAAIGEIKEPSNTGLLIGVLAAVLTGAGVFLAMRRSTA